MELINLYSEKGMVNLFADFILNKFDKKHKTIIEVYDTGHFFIVNGISTSSEVLKLSEIKDEFISIYGKVLESLGYNNNFNIMDLIYYDDKKIEQVHSIWSTYYDSPRPLFNYKSIKEKFHNEKYLSVDFEDFFVQECQIGDSKHDVVSLQKSLKQKSNFPYGYSLNMGRLLLFYGEHIMFRMRNELFLPKMTLEITESKNIEKEQVINVISDSIDSNVLKSLILDNFDFDYDEFQKLFQDYNFCDELTKPISDKPWLF